MVKLDELINNNIFICFLLIVIGYFIAKMFANSCNCANGFSVGAQTDQCRRDNLCSGKDEGYDFCWDPQVGLNAGLIDRGNFKENCDTQEGMFQYSGTCDSNTHEFYVPLTDAGGYYNGRDYDHCLQESSDPREIYACGVGGTKCLDCTNDINKNTPACINNPQTNQVDCEKDCTAQFGTFSCKNNPLNQNKVKCQQNLDAKKVDPQNNIFANIDDCLAEGCGHKCDPKLGQQARTGCNKPTNDRDGGFETVDDCHNACKPKWGCPPNRPKDKNGCVECHKFMPGEPGHNVAQYDTKQKCKEGHCGDIYTCDHPTGKCTCTDVNAGQGQKKPACNVNCNKEKFVKYVCPNNKKFSTAGCITKPADSLNDPFSWDSTLPGATEMMGHAKTECDSEGSGGQMCNKPCEYDFNTECIYDNISNTCTKNINTTAGTGIYSDLNSCEFKDDNMTCTIKDQDYMTNCPKECEGEIDFTDSCNPELIITRQPNDIAVANNLGCKAKFPQFDVIENANINSKHYLRNKPITGDCSPCNKGIYKSLCSNLAYPNTVCHLDSNAKGDITCDAECKSGFMPNPNGILNNCVKVQQPTCKADTCSNDNEICVESGAGKSKCICDDGYVRNNQDNCVLPPVDCLGDWSKCEANCNMTYDIYRSLENGGEECRHATGDVKKCMFGTDNCVDQCIGINCPTQGAQCFNIPADNAAYTTKCLGAKGAKGDAGKDHIDVNCSSFSTKELCTVNKDCEWSPPLVVVGPYLCKPKR